MYIYCNDIALALLFIRAKDLLKCFFLRNFNLEEKFQYRSDLDKRVLPPTGTIWPASLQICIVNLELKQLRNSGSLYSINGWIITHAVFSRVFNVSNYHVQLYPV